MLWKYLKANEIDMYMRKLQMVGSLSRLFSDSDVPYLYYRAAERIFCGALGAVDRSRCDVSIDATAVIKNKHFGIGLKTFLNGNKSTFQKVTELNSLRPEYEKLSDKALARYIADARNRRIDTTQSQYDSEFLEYHLVTRSSGSFQIYEYPMDRIKTNKLKLVSSRNNSVSFSDGIHDYLFNKSKSTLFMRFDLSSELPLLEFPVRIFDNPLKELERRFIELPSTQKKEPEIYLPLFSTKSNSYGDVPEHSGLNQWNAGGRDRHPDEVYIPVPSEIHRLYPGFLPKNRERIFEVELPNGELLKCKMCQDNAKGLMSNPNRTLGKWLLRDVIKVKEHQLVTRKILNRIGIDSVQLIKKGPKSYKLDFCGIGTYDKFIEQGLGFLDESTISS